MSSVNYNIPEIFAVGSGSARLETGECDTDLQEGKSWSTMQLQTSQLDKSGLQVV